MLIQINQMARFWSKWSYIYIYIALIQEKNVAFKNYRDSSNNIALKCLEYQTCLNASIEVAKKCHNTVNELMNTQKNYIDLD